MVVNTPRVAQDLVITDVCSTTMFCPTVIKLSLLIRYSKELKIVADSKLEHL